MRTRLIGLSALVGILAVGVVATAQTNGQSMSGLTLTPAPTPAEKPYVIRIPRPFHVQIHVQSPKELQAQAAKELLTRTVEERAARNQPAVVCGMLVIPADPSIDSAMVKSAPHDKTYTIKTIQPSMCARQPR